MKLTSLPPIAPALLAALSLSLPAGAENLEDLRQLLSTKKCPGCDLSGSGLVQSNLAGARLSGANLANANLSQANLTGADLSGANLTGASLYGANLTGADLSGATLNATDLREAYLAHANFSGTILDNAYVEGATGIPNSAGTPELFFDWGLLETKKGNYSAAMEHFNKALSLNPEYASAYLGQGYVFLRTGKDEEAKANMETAIKLFRQQDNPAGYETAQNLLDGIVAVENAKKKEANDAQIGNLVRGVGLVLMRFLPVLGLF